MAAERERHLRIAAGVPDAPLWTVSLVKLPAGPSCFRTRHRAAKASQLEAAQSAEHDKGIRKATALGFAGLRLHDLRGTQETLLLGASRCMSSPLDAGTIRLSCCGATRNARARPILRPRTFISALAKGALN